MIPSKRMSTMQDSASLILAAFCGAKLPKTNYKSLAELNLSYRYINSTQDRVACTRVGDRVIWWSLAVYNRLSSITCSGARLTQNPMYSHVLECGMTSTLSRPQLKVTPALAPLPGVTRPGRPSEPQHRDAGVAFTITTVLDIGSEVLMLTLASSQYWMLKMSVTINSLY
jgi:hypothetical protein